MANQFGGRRQSKQWEGLPGNVVSMTIGATVLFSSFTGGIPFTILRMLGEYVITPDAAPTAQDNADITVAIGVVSADAAALGSAAMSDPAQEPEYPWLYWAMHPFFFVGAETDPNSAASSVRRSFDIRSMRKLKPRESLALVVQYEDVAGAPALQICAGKTRLLMGLH